MSLSKFITRRDPSEIRDLGINLNDFAPARDLSPFQQAIRNAVTRVQPTGIMNQPFIGRDFSQFDEAKMGEIPVSQPIRDYGDSELMESDTTTRDGIMSKINPLNALGFLTNLYTGGLSNALTTSGVGELFSKIAEAGRNTPNYQFTNPNKPGFNRMASDFYDPRTGLDRFDRAKTLFGQSRTMKEFLDKLKDKRAAEKAAAAAKLADARRAIAENRYGGDPTYGEGQQAGMGFGGGRSDPTDKS